MRTASLRINALYQGLFYMSRWYIYPRGRERTNPKFTVPKKLRPSLGGGSAARDPVWDGEGWGCDRVACLLIPGCQRSLALAVAIAGRLSPSETHTFGSLCDCRLTKRYPVSVQATTFSFWLSSTNSPLSVFTVSTAWPSPFLSRTTVISSASRGQPASTSILRFSST